MLKFLKLGILVSLFVLPLSSNAQSEERILVFDSQIEVQKDSTIIVTEIIKVQSLNEQIRHGIYRDLPVAYADEAGRRYLVSYEILEVERNGETEQHHTERS
ncbi:MAG TPA: DUF2207 domain-containing protein, partial [Flavobacterium sp.]|nr:DUF2207 domain-containing protein [Flavobacterium sp.]